MIDGGNYHIEIADRIATMYVIGKLPLSSRLIAVCKALPGTVEVLSVNLDAVDEMGQAELGAVDTMRTYWQRTRRGPFRVAFSLASATRSRSYKVRVGT